MSRRAGESENRGFFLRLPDSSSHYLDDYFAGMAYGVSANSIIREALEGRPVCSIVRFPLVSSVGATSIKWAAPTELFSDKKPPYYKQVVPTGLCRHALETRNEKLRAMQKYFGKPAGIPLGEGWRWS